MKHCLPLLPATRLPQWMLVGLLLTAHLAQAQGKSPLAVAAPEDSVTLYLTFDDGIIPASEMLQTLTMEEAAPITVFWIGKFVLHSDTTRRIWRLLENNAYITAGNHSYSHANSHYHQFFHDPQQVLVDFRTNQDSLQFVTHLARLPGRNTWRLAARKRDDLPDGKVAADSLAMAGYTVFGWDLEWNYTATNNQLESVDDLLFRIKQVLQYHRCFTPGHIVLLCHDPALSNPVSITVLRQFIRKARQAGFRFRSLMQYPDQRVIP
ncbi:polysaccharide deacetylase family protein [Paraflavitalea pollutisoli]|uniref:polysaccharide deacetylase family protein n=1 Tax=Paraflavitalea pollutisoli TaxID=3034143 RepID=UPI0023EBE472|nr:polysaccharide deacetylase family protein [Paraflavitalea sp. H1-2-19X]